MGALAVSWHGFPRYSGDIDFFVIFTLTALAQVPADPAIETHLRELAARPDNSLASFRLGEIFLKQNNYQSAANHFRTDSKGTASPTGWSSGHT